MDIIMNPDVTVKRRIKKVSNESNPRNVSGCSDKRTPPKRPRPMRTRSSPRVHFSQDPVSSILEIPRVSVYPALVPSKESLASIIPYLNHLGVQVEVFLTDLEAKDVVEVGQLAEMDSSRIKHLKGIEGKVRKVRVVKKALKNYHRHLLKAKQLQTKTFMDKEKFSGQHSTKSTSDYFKDFKLWGGEFESFTFIGETEKPVNLSKSERRVGSANIYKSQSEVEAMISKIPTEEVNVLFKTGETSSSEEEIENLSNVKEGNDASKKYYGDYNETFLSSNIDIEDEIEIGNEDTSKSRTANSCVVIQNIQNIPKMTILNSEIKDKSSVETVSDLGGNFDDVALFSDKLDDALNSMEKGVDEKLENMGKEKRLAFLKQISRFQARLVSLQNKASNM